MQLLLQQEEFTKLSFAQRSVLMELLMFSNEFGVVQKLEGQLSAETNIPRTSLRRILEALKTAGYIEFQNSKQDSNGRKVKSVSICNFDSYKSIPRFQNNFQIQVSKPGRGELGPYIRSKGYKFTVKSFTDYENAHAWSGNQGDTWQDLCDRFALTDEAAANANRRDLFTPPSEDEAKEVYREGGYHFDIEKFYSHYSSNGWRVGRVKMCDLRSAMDTWEKSYKESHPEAFVVSAPKTAVELEYEKAMVERFPRLMAVAYPLTLAQYNHLKTEALSRNEIDKLVGVLTRLNGGDLSRVKVAYDIICAMMNYEKKIL
ncbi:MAG: MarR family transcriptional regulator [Paludibacteraceae bacterium]|nr:MarR family transcriptional regulator [Paludibacteraceae bacterium]